MKCPYCSKEMEFGYIQCRDGLAWTPKKQLVAALSSLGRDSVTLNNGASARATAVYAHKCEECKKVIIDYSSDDKRP